MAPTYSEGDEVLVEKLSRGARDPERGAVVVFRRPDSDELMIKRVVALGDQTVAIRDGVLTVDGQHPTEPYVDRIVAGSYFGPVQVPAGAVFVLGDKRLGSVDSRTFGAVPIDAVIGRVVLRIWPP
jgi:signal peptidase I